MILSESHVSNVQSEELQSCDQRSNEDTSIPPMQFISMSMFV